MSIVDNGVTVYSSSGASRMQRSGTCNRCGMCCAGCSHLIFKATVQIKLGAVITPSGNMVAECNIYAVKDQSAGIDYQNKGCAQFPPAPQSQPLQCSFTWISAPVEVP